MADILANAHDLFSTSKLSKELKAWVQLRASKANVDSRADNEMHPSQGHILLAHRLAECVQHAHHLNCFGRLRQHLEDTGIIEDVRIERLGEETATRCKELENQMLQERDASQEKLTAAKQECDRLWSAIRKVQLQIQNAVLDSTNQHWCTGMIEARHRKKVAMLEDDLQRLLKHQEQVIQRHTAQKLQMEHDIEDFQMISKQTVESLANDNKTLDIQIKGINDTQRAIEAMLARERQSRDQRLEQEGAKVQKFMLSRAARCIQRAWTQYRTRCALDSAIKAKRKPKKGKKPSAKRAPGNPPRGGASTQKKPQGSVATGQQLGTGRPGARQTPALEESKVAQNKTRKTTSRTLPLKSALKKT